MKSKKIKILVTAKTYPTISSKYNETVCTAGITGNGSLLRLYPICYRSLPKQQKFKKYQWISCKVIRDIRDPRKESYKLISSIRPSDIVTTKQKWQDRRSIILSDVQLDLQKIIEAAYDSNKWKSLFTFKPTSIIKFNIIDQSTDEKINRKKRNTFT
jgi:hypothetical protein